MTAVSLWYPSANRDADVFADPFTFDVTPVAEPARGLRRPRGALLPRGQPRPREIRVMFEELLARVADIELLGEPVYNMIGLQGMIMYSLSDLPVRLTPR